MWTHRVIEREATLDTGGDYSIWHILQTYHFHVSGFPYTEENPDLPPLLSEVVKFGMNDMGALREAFHCH